jgi:hypothetical protein
MSNRKATFAKRQRETDLKERARAKEARLAERRANPQATTKGPEIDWSAQVIAVTETDPADNPALPEPTPPASADSAD